MPNKVKQPMGSKIRQARHEAGLCIRCGGEREIKRFCRACAEIENDRARRYKTRNRTVIRERWHRYYAGKGREIKQQYYLNNRERLIGYAAGYKRPNQPLKTRYPYFTDDLLQRINELVPRFDENLRADICQELALMVISGEIQESELSLCLPVVVKNQRKFMPSIFAVPLDGIEDWQRDKIEKKIVRQGLL